MLRNSKFKDRNLKQLYNISLADYKKMSKEQNHRCALCFRQPELFKYNLAVDHDHSTNRVRGLLCQACNRLLTHYRTADFFKRVVLYLEK